jgi:manganese transport protein
MSVNRLAAILLWSVIAAAFIGPGTVTTAASAGAGYGLVLLWTLVFSTVACLVLQEASGRLTVVSGQTLGQSLRRRYRVGVLRAFVLILVLGAILVGCAAYEAGNILGGVAGAALVVDWPTEWLALVAGAVAAGLLWFQAPRQVARALSLVVAVMGVAFLVTAWQIMPSWRAVVHGSLVPSLPEGSGVLALGLIGTTVVPYNIFLGSGLASRQHLGDLRLGLAVAIGLGGLISMGVLIVGTALDGPFSFVALGEVLSYRLGGWASALFALGLLGAGLSSAITAPLAAAITARDMLSQTPQDPRWSVRSWRYRSVWLGVLLTGVVFGISDVQPIPAIILAQALNGLLLPLVAIFLFVAVNDRSLMGDAVNPPPVNALMVGVVIVSVLLGVSATGRAAAKVLGVEPPSLSVLTLVTVAVVLSLAYPVWHQIRKGR